MESLVKKMEILATISILPKSCSDSVSNKFHVHPQWGEWLKVPDLGEMRSIISGHVPVINGKPIFKAFQQKPDEAKKSNLTEASEGVFFLKVHMYYADERLRARTHPANDCGI